MRILKIRSTLGRKTSPTALRSSLLSPRRGKSSPCAGRSQKVTALSKGEGRGATAPQNLFAFFRGEKVVEVRDRMRGRSRPFEGQHHKAPGFAGLEFLHIGTPLALKWQEPSLECGSSLPLSRPQACYRTPYHGPCAYSHEDNRHLKNVETPCPGFPGGILTAPSSIR